MKNSNNTIGNRTRDLPACSAVKKYGRVRKATDDNIIRRMRFACWITKATDTYLEYVILIAFTRRQWLRERASMLYVHCLSYRTLNRVVRKSNDCVLNS
jgi:hypothetical protein